MRHQGIAFALLLTLLALPVVAQDYRDTSPEPFTTLEIVGLVLAVLAGIAAAIVIIRYFMAIIGCLMPLILVLGGRRQPDIIHSP